MSGAQTNCMYCAQIYLICLVAKEMNFTVFLFNVLQAVGLVPSLGKDIKADLATY